MLLKEKHVLEFQRLYKKVYGENINYDEALFQCLALVNLCEIVFRPITKADVARLPK
jgi:hypothetical protein